MKEIKKSLIDLILFDYTNFNMALFFPVVSFLKDYSKIFNENPLLNLNNRDNSYFDNRSNCQDRFLIKRNQDRKNINRQTRKANSGFVLNDSYYTKSNSNKQNHERDLKGGFYCSYFSDLERENQKFRKYR